MIRVQSPPDIAAVDLQVLAEVIRSCCPNQEKSEKRIARYPAALFVVIPPSPQSRFLSPLKPSADGS
jgi:hypothetical protein